MHTRVQNHPLGARAESTLDRLLQQVRAWAAEESLKYRMKRERRQLAAMSDDLLRDLGISRADAEIEASRTDIPAARALHESRYGR